MRFSSKHHDAGNQNSKADQLLLPSDATKLLFELQEVPQGMLILVSVRVLHKANPLNQELVHVCFAFPAKFKSSPLGLVTLASGMAI